MFPFFMFYIVQNTGIRKSRYRGISCTSSILILWINLWANSKFSHLCDCVPHSKKDLHKFSVNISSKYHRCGFEALMLIECRRNTVNVVQHIPFFFIRYYGSHFPCFECVIIGSTHKIQAMKWKCCSRWGVTSQ